MCTGGRLLADFLVGTRERPEVPDVVGDCLTVTADGTWVVWAHKVARPDGDMFRPLVGGEPYPVDAVATCRMDDDLLHPHDAPDPACTCGFHALSHPWLIQSAGVVRVEVALSGRILAYEWPQAGVLFRAARQTVLRLDSAHRRSSFDHSGRVAGGLASAGGGGGPGGGTAGGGFASTGGGVTSGGGGVTAGGVTAGGGVPAGGGGGPGGGFATTGGGFASGGGGAPGGKPDDPDGRLARRRGEVPSGAGPVCLPVPRTAVLQFTM